MSSPNVSNKTHEKTKVFNGRYITKNGIIILNTIPNQFPIFSKSEEIILYIIYTYLPKSINWISANTLSIYVLIIIIIISKDKIKYSFYFCSKIYITHICNRILAGGSKNHTLLIHTILSKRTICQVKQGSIFL